VRAESLRPELGWAIAAMQDKKAKEVTVLDLAGVGAFATYFVICTAESGPQMKAIADAVEERLRPHGVKPEHREGGKSAEWLLLDYGGFVVHIFSRQGREYYNLERLWRMAQRYDVGEAGPGPAE
jgi:ribosome-associated protein